MRNPRLALTLLACFFVCPVLAAPEETPDSAVTAEIPPSAKSFPRWNFGVSNNFYAYNGENTAWDQTRITLTYLDDLVEPFVLVRASEILSFKAGVGLLVAMNQEQKVREHYPIVQSKISFSDWSATFGSLDGGHDFPAPILDPLTTFVAQIRTNGSDQVPVHYETFPRTGEYTHGAYEYGLAVKWFHVDNRGEIYLNWHLPDTAQHRERFDAGLTHRVNVDGVPLYFGAHYWHNGGHENNHPIPVTENYTVGLGLRDDYYNFLILGSLFLPNRQANAFLNVAGSAVYADVTLRSGNWSITPSLFASDELRNPANRYFSVEGDPFFRVPFYIGINFEKKWQWFEGSELKLAFVNGFFQRSVNEKFNPTQMRYDQLLRFTFRYLFGKES